MTLTTFLHYHLGWSYFQHEDGSAFYPSISVLFAIALLAIRICCERFLLRPLAAKMGVYPQKRPRNLRNSAELEEFYKQTGLNVGSRRVVQLNASPERLIGVAKGVGMTPRQVENWLRARQDMDGPDNVDKFTENGWHIIYYSFAFSGTLYYVWDESWLWDSRDIWREWPQQKNRSALYWIYMIQIGHYMSLLFSILFLKYHRLKDAREMCCHHCITITLMCVSWMANCVRIGVLVLLTHDISDPGLNLAKLLWGSKRKKAAENVLFVTFAVWIVTRLIYFPATIIKSSMFDVLVVSRTSMDRGIYWVTNSLLVMLLLLNINWTIRFLRLIGQKVEHGEVKKENEFDDSSGSDHSDGQPQDNNNGKKSK